MTLKFKYKKVKRPNNTEVKSPSIPVVLQGKGNKYEFIALVDSGADISAIPKDVADLLGLDLTGNLEETRGIGGIVKAVQSKISLEIKRPHESHLINLKVKVILDGNDKEMPIILGRSGFFDYFIITFNQKNETISLKKII